MDIVSVAPSLHQVFGPESTGVTAADHARSSTVEFVRSQDELAFATPDATGRRLSAWEAYAAFGLEKLQEVADFGSAVLVADRSEPGATIRHRREMLELEAQDVGRFVGLSKVKIEQAERPDRATPIRDLERIARSLGLDEMTLGVRPRSEEGDFLASRLRSLKYARPEFTPGVVLRFAEAAWIAKKQADLSDLLFGGGDIGKRGFQPDSRYGDRDYPAWRLGYDLAATSRRMLGFADDEPVYLTHLVERVLRIPLINLSLPARIAGATIANGAVRGIAINTEGQNANVWIRRATIAHELGHLLWDPDQKLNSLIVDTFDVFDGGAPARHDPVEARANAFSIEFLAPRAHALTLYHGGGLRAVMEHFGVSFTSARYQVWNALERKVPLDSFAVDDLEPTNDWAGKEFGTIDYFKPADVPQSRRGLFSGIVVAAMRRRLISEDSAAAYLDTSRAELARSAEVIEQLFELSASKL